MASKFEQEIRLRIPDTMGPGGKTLNLLAPLLSNNKEVIEWFAGYDKVYDMQRIEKPNTNDFWAYQAIIALRGDWGRLTSRCHTVLHSSPLPTCKSFYISDYKFYLSLARGNVQEMEGALAEMITLKALRSRSNHESGYTDDLISTAAVIYAKIAGLHGYKVNIDTPYIPAEWLSMEPLPFYDPHFQFLKSCL